MIKFIMISVETRAASLHPSISQSMNKKKQTTKKDLCEAQKPLPTMKTNSKQILFSLKNEKSIPLFFAISLFLYIFQASVSTSG